MLYCILYCIPCFKKTKIICFGFCIYYSIVRYCWMECFSNDRTVTIEYALQSKPVNKNPAGMENTSWSQQRSNSCQCEVIIMKNCSSNNVILHALFSSSLALLQWSFHFGGAFNKLSSLYNNKNMLWFCECASRGTAAIIVCNRNGLIRYVDYVI